MILQLPLLMTHQQWRQQWRWWWYRRRVFSRGLLASRRTRVCLAASYLIRRLSTALLGVGHHRVAALYVFKLADGQRAAQNYVSLQEKPSASRFSLHLSSSSFLPSIQRRSGTFRSLALLLRSYSWSEGRENGRRTPATLLRLLEKSKPLRASASNPSPSFPRPIRITSRWVWMF